MMAELTARPLIGIAVIEDDPIRLVGLRSILDGVPGFRLAAKALSDIATDQTVAVAILRYFGPKCLENIATLKVVRPDVKVLVTGTGADDESILQAITSGAKGYVDEAAPTPDLVQAIFALHQGSVWIPRHVISMYIDRSAGRPGRNSQGPGSSFTSRETQVLEMLLEGRSNKEIARLLGIEERTVKAHVARLMRKAGVKNRVALSIHAIHHSLARTAAERFAAGTVRSAFPALPRMHSGILPN
jgi:DNA-binding NarL/FixJ family response regulator